MAEEKKITVTSQEERRFAPPKSFVEKAYIKSHDERMKLWKESIKNPDEFWLKIAKSEIGLQTA
jgi:hypothetical protein